MTKLKHFLILAVIGEIHPKTAFNKKFLYIPFVLRVLISIERPNSLNKISAF